MVASLALFVALGGTSYAVAKLPKNSVGSREVKDGSLQSKDLAAGVVTAGAAGARGPRGSEGPQGPVGPSNVRLANAPMVELSRQAGVPTVVAALRNVDPGQYLASFSSELSFRDTGGLYVYCDILVNGNKVTGTRGIVGEMYGGSEAVSDMTVLKRDAPFDLTLSCAPDQSFPTAKAPPAMFATKLALVRVGSVSSE